MASIMITTVYPVLDIQTVHAASLNQSSGFHCGSGDLIGPLGLLVQGILAFIAFTSLIVKRFCEPKHRRRPWRIWFYDTSKQALGACVIHFANVFLASVFQGDPCTWYVVSFLLDSTIGLLVIYIGLKISQCIVIRKGNKTLLFGEYGTPPQCNAWAGQCGLYMLVTIIEKILMTLLVQFRFWEKVRKFIMSPIKDPHMELIIVMFIVPLIVNAIIFWVVDNFLMKKRQYNQPEMTLTKSSESVQYFKTSTKLKYYGRNKTKKQDDSDSDVLLAQEDTADAGTGRVSHHHQQQQQQQQRHQDYNDVANGGRYHLLETIATS